MLFHVSGLGDQPLVGTAGDLPVSDAQPLTLTLRPIDDEQLVAASLVIGAGSGSGSSSAPVELRSSNDGAWTGVTWVMASWDSVRSVQSLTLEFASKPNPLVIRVSIAQGGSGWFLPPGPHTFTLGAAMQLHAVLPDTVADRVLVELLDGQGSPVSADLSPVAPVGVLLGRKPRELELRVRGRRSLLRWSGAIPAEGWALEDLHARLRSELRSELRGEEVVLELRAAVAGELMLSWELDALRVAERFADASTTRSFEVGFASEHSEALLSAETEAVALESLVMAVSAAPSTEQLVPRSSTTTSSGDGQRVGQLHDAAQLITLAQPHQLTAIDVLVRGLVDGTTVTLSLHADDGGRPAAAPLVELQQEISARMFEPDWVSFGFTTPVLVEAGRWWVMLKVGDGELMWLVSSATTASGLFHRRDRASWLRCVPSREAVLRARALAQPPAEPVSLWLQGHPIDGGAAWELPLDIDEDGVARWSSGSVTPPVSNRIALRVAAAVTTAVTLSDLVLRYRTPLA